MGIGIHVFMCTQASDSNAEFSWRHVCKPEVLITWQRKHISSFDAIWVAIPMFLGGVHWFICQPHPTLPSPWNTRWRTDIGSNYNLATETWSQRRQRLRQCFRARTLHFHRHRHLTTPENTVMYKQEVLVNNLETETDAVLRNRTMAIPMEVDRAWPKTLPQTLC